jgi:suppressor of ftsI
MIPKIRSILNTYGLIYTFSISMFVLMTVFAFQSSGFNAFAQNQSSYLAGMNFTKSQDVYSKNGFLNTTLVAGYKIGEVGNQTTVAMVYNGSIPGPTYHVYP